MGVQIDHHYFLGILAGEGSFITDISKASRLTIGIRMRPACRIEMHNVDSEMLHSMRDSLGFGNIVERSNEHTTLAFRNQNDVEQLITLIDNTESTLFKNSHKYECYKRWKNVAEMLIRGEHTQDHERAKEIIDMAHEVNQQFGGWGKGSQYWKGLIDESED